MSSLRSQFFCGRCVVSKNVDRVRSTSPSAATGVDIRERGGDSRVLTRHTRTPAARFLSTSSTQTDGETRHCMTHTHSERERRTQTQTHNSLGKRMPVRLPFCPDGPAGTGQGTWKFPDFFWFFFFWFPPEFALSAFLIGAGRLATRFRWDSSSSALSRKLFALLRSGIVHATDELVAVYRLWWLPFLPPSAPNDVRRSPFWRRAHPPFLFDHLRQRIAYPPDATRFGHLGSWSFNLRKGQQQWPIFLFLFF